MEIQLLRADSSNIDFVSLVKLLDDHLAMLDGEDHAFYHQFNKIDMLKNVVLLYEDNIAVSCGAFKEFTSDCVEVKRMYTLPSYRGRGYAAKVLNELEKWAAETGYAECILETGKKQPEAIALYKKCGYHLIPNFGPYAADENSVCFKKKID